MKETQPGKRSQSPPVLRTQRLLLRPFTSDDAAAVRHVVDNVLVASTTQSITLPFSEAMAQEWIERQVASWHTQSAAVYAICWDPPDDSQDPSKDDPLLIGAVGLEIYQEDEKGELGYWLAEDYWGRGVATEAAQEMVTFAFETLCLNKVVAFHMVRNPASGRVLEKVGMQQEGVFRDHVKKWDQFEDVVAYGVVRAEAIKYRPPEKS